MLPNGKEACLNGCMIAKTMMNDVTTTLVAEMFSVILRGTKGACNYGQDA
jgi:hypothetical protein